MNSKNLPPDITYQYIGCKLEEVGVKVLTCHAELYFILHNVLNSYVAPF